jgi:N-dimethylarginine dimethylaminohydrolase
MTFAGDCGVVFGRTFLASNFRHPQRQPETQYYSAWFAAHHYEVIHPPEKVFFEGLGDIIYEGTSVVIGHGPRSSAESCALVREVFPHLNILAQIELAGEDFFHVGLAAALLDERTLLYHPEAFTKASQTCLEQVFPRIIRICERDARENFVCNNIRISRTLLIDDCTESLEHELAGLGYKVVKCDMSEFKKSGGSIRCLIVAI